MFPDFIKTHIYEREIKSLFILPKSWELEFIIKIELTSFFNMWFKSSGETIEILISSVTKTFPRSETLDFFTELRLVSERRRSYGRTHVFIKGDLSIQRDAGVKGHVVWGSDRGVWVLLFFWGFFVGALGGSFLLRCGGGASFLTSVRLSEHISQNVQKILNEFSLRLQFEEKCLSCSARPHFCRCFTPFK